MQKGDITSSLYIILHLTLADCFAVKDYAKGYDIKLKRLLKYLLITWK